MAFRAGEVTIVVPPGSASIPCLPWTSILTSNDGQMRKSNGSPHGERIVASAGLGGDCCAPTGAGAQTAAARPSVPSAIRKRRGLVVTDLANIRALPFIR